MELFFIRHGEGEHTLNVPDSLMVNSPSLTDYGMKQAGNLKNTLALTPQDVVIASPTLRTLQTARIWSEGVDCRKFVSPYVGPRIFPVRLQASTLPCDELLDVGRIQSDFSSFHFMPSINSSLWAKGINTLSEEDFRLIANVFVLMCQGFQYKRIFIVTHDGTITSYRQIYSEKLLTREDFLKETEWFRLLI